MSLVLTRGVYVENEGVELVGNLEGSTIGKSQMKIQRRQHTWAHWIV